MELRPTEHAEVDPQSEAWFASFTERPAGHAPERRRRRNHHRRRREAAERRRRERITDLMMLGSMLLVGAMTAVFYSVLTR